MPNGWCWASFEQLAAPVPYSLAIGPFGSNLKVSDYKADGVPLIFVRNIRSGLFGGQYTQHVSREKADELAAHSVEAGDLLVTKMGDPPGDARMYPDTEPSAIITADCIKVRFSPSLSQPKYFEYATNSLVVRSQILKVTTGVAQQKVSLGRFSPLALPLPPIQEQSEILSQLDDVISTINATEAEITRQLTKAASLRQAILKAAFSGKLLNDSSPNRTIEAAA